MENGGAALAAWNFAPNDALLGLTALSVRGVLGRVRAGMVEARQRRRRAPRGPAGARRPVGVPVLPDGAGGRGRRRRRAPVRGVQLLRRLRRPGASTEVRLRS